MFELRSTRDIVIIIAFVTLVVSSTAAWAINDQGSYTANFVQIMDSPLNIIDKAASISSGSMNVDLDVKNEGGSLVTVDIMVQIVNSTGDPLYVNPSGSDPSREIIGESDVQSVTFNPSQQKSLSFSVDLLGRTAEADGYTIFIEQDTTNFTTRGELTETGTQRDMSDSAIVYRTDDTGTPWHQYPQWRSYGGTWSAESQLPELISSSTITTDVIRMASTSDSATTQYISTIWRSDGNLNNYLFDSSTWTKAAFNTYIGLSSENIKPFDVEYETFSNDAIVVYAGSTAGQIKGKQLIGSTWYTMPVLTIGSSTIKYIKLAANPGFSSNEVALIAVAQDLKAYAAIWNGNSWQDAEEVTGTYGASSYYASSYQYETADITYRYDSEKPLVAIGSGRYILLQNYDSSRTSGDRWNAESSWYDTVPPPFPWLPPSTGPAGLKEHAGSSANIRWVVFASRMQSTSDNLALLTLDNTTGARVSGYLQNSIGGGYSWQSVKTLATTMYTSNYRTIDAAWAPDGSQYWVFGVESASTDLSYKTFAVDYGVFDEDTNGVDEWFTYTLGGPQVQMVQVRETPFIGEPNFFVTTIDSNAVIRTVTIETTLDPSVQTGFALQQITATHATQYDKECFDLAVNVE